MNIGIIGFGAMGSAMAKNLVAAGHDVKGWNRSPIALDGVKMVASPAEAFQSDAVLTMLSDDDAIRSSLLDQSALQDAKPGLVHIVCSTISIAFVEELIELHEKNHLGYVAAPVLGRPDVAEKGELQILAGGAPELIAKVRPILDVIGGRVWEMGTDPKAANVAKIACNMMITMAIEAMAEAVVLTESEGLSRDKFFELILGTLFGSRSYQVYSEKIAAGQYKAGFKATLGLKDLRLASEVAKQAGRTLPMLVAVHGQMTDTVSAGRGDQDWSAMADFTIRRADTARPAR